LHWTVADAVPSHSPEHSAEQEPWQFAAAMTEPSHVALTLHVPAHCTESDPGAQSAVTSGAVQLALPVQFAWHMASADALTVHSPPEIESPHSPWAVTPPSPLRAAVIAFEAWVQASVVCLSSVDIAVHV